MEKYDEDDIVRNVIIGHKFSNELCAKLMELKRAILKETGMKEKNVTDSDWPTIEWTVANKLFIPFVHLERISRKALREGIESLPLAIPEIYVSFSSLEYGYVRDLPGEVTLFAITNESSRHFAEAIENTLGTESLSCSFSIVASVGKLIGVGDQRKKQSIPFAFTERCDSLTAFRKDAKSYFWELHTVVIGDDAKSLSKTGT